MDEVEFEEMSTEAYEDHVARLTTPMFQLNGNTLHNIEFVAYANAFGGEAGELQNVVKKMVKQDALYGDSFYDSDLPIMFLYEAGDALWYLTKLIMLAGYSLEEVMQANIEKLDARRMLNENKGHYIVTPTSPQR